MLLTHVYNMNTSIQQEQEIITVSMWLSLADPKETVQTVSEHTSTVDEHHSLPHLLHFIAAIWYWVQESGY